MERKKKKGEQGGREDNETFDSEKAVMKKGMRELEEEKGESILLVR